jgi:SagB-type dehydrogenase family enzyme
MVGRHPGPASPALAVPLVAGALGLVMAASGTASVPATASPQPDALELPAPILDGPLSLEETLARRRSVRTFAAEALDAADIGQLLWAAQGVTDADGGRTAPSAGATYPLELLAVTADGVARYLPDRHALRWLHRGDIRALLATAAYEQPFLADAPLIVVVAAVPARTAARYGARADRYVTLEAGHAAQSLLLQAVALGLGAVPVGAFDDAAVVELVGLADGEEPLYLLPVGHPAGGSPTSSD